MLKPTRVVHTYGRKRRLHTTAYRAATDHTHTATSAFASVFGNEAAATEHTAPSTELIAEKQQQPASVPATKKESSPKPVAQHSEEEEEEGTRAAVSKRCRRAREHTRRKTPAADGQATPAVPPTPTATEQPADTGAASDVLVEQISAIDLNANTAIAAADPHTNDTTISSNGGSSASMLRPHRVVTTYAGKRSIQSGDSLEVRTGLPMQSSRWNCIAEELACNVLKSKHELRELGLQRRFADELDDLIASIAMHRAASLRRSSAMLLCRKMQDARFTSVFRQRDFLVKFHDTLAAEEGDTLLQACCLFILAVLVADGRVGAWLASRGLVDYLGGLLGRPDVAWTTSSASANGIDGKQSSQPSHHAVSVHIIAAVTSPPRSNGARWPDSPGNRSTFVRLLSLFCDRIERVRQSDGRVALLLLLLWLTVHLAQATKNEQDDSGTLQELALCALRLCISMSDNHPDAANLLCSLGLPPIVMQTIYRWSRQHAGDTDRNAEGSTVYSDMLLLSLGLLVNMVEQSAEGCQQLRAMRISTSCRQESACWHRCSCEGDQLHATVHLARLFQCLYDKHTTASAHTPIAHVANVYCTLGMLFLPYAKLASAIALAAALLEGWQVADANPNHAALLEGRVVPSNPLPQPTMNAILKGYSALGTFRAMDNPGLFIIKAISNKDKSEVYFTCGSTSSSSPLLAFYRVGRSPYALHCTG
ncbi:hypothetical protein SYNPS1DRAFT_27738 [Syncephalis pseudoplumigaleata]|uniref:Wings apart-like protein C-terminal domain-containing protein n=1 Tax=Syncephalis pseudoplumigaleata TaxID=1712513 RepID=A0A4P9Z4S6_9FUNG|nr:hypothetical protein SYNPS1DRAFT_27738 [Syncephalis pseudoplumigaleata]|eukprot:RKP26580.1 hypothetical protein SYNPS1DRAFT_27738 [Syncephalis pseudoplumigaleata]